MWVSSQQACEVGKGSSYGGKGLMSGVLASLRVQRVGPRLRLQPGPRSRACLPGRYLHAICSVLRKPSEQFLSRLS